MLIFPLIFVLIFSQIEGNIDVGKKEHLQESKELNIDVDRLNDDLSQKILEGRPRSLQSFPNRNVIRRNVNLPAESPILYEKPKHSKIHNNVKREISKRKNSRRKHKKQLKKNNANSTLSTRFQYNNESSITTNYHDRGSQENLNFINPAEEEPEDTNETENLHKNPKVEKVTLKNIPENRYLQEENDNNKANAQLRKEDSISENDINFNIPSTTNPKEDVQNQTVIEAKNNMNANLARANENKAGDTGSNCIYSSSTEPRILEEDGTIAKYNGEQDYPLNKTVTLSKHIVYTPAGSNTSNMYDKTEYHTLEEVEYFKDHYNVKSSNVSYNKMMEPVENSIDTGDSADSNSYLDRILQKKGTPNILTNSDENINKITHEFVRIPYDQQIPSNRAGLGFAQRARKKGADCCNVEVIENMKALYSRHLKDCYQALDIRKESKYDVLGTTACIAECAAIRDQYVRPNTTIVDDKILDILKCSFENMPWIQNILDAVVNTCSQRFKSFPPETFPCRKSNILEVGRCVGGMLQNECYKLYPPQRRCEDKLRVAMTKYCRPGSPGYGCDLPN